MNDTKQPNPEGGMMLRQRRALESKVNLCSKEYIEKKKMQYEIRTRNKRIEKYKAYLEALDYQIVLKKQQENNDLEINEELF